MRNVAQRLGLRTFWQWWTGHLVPLMPAGSRNAMRRRRLRPMLALDTDAATLWAPGMIDGTLGFKETARIPLSGDPAAVVMAGRAAIDALPQVAYGGAVAEAKVVVALPAGQVLRKTLTLPAAVEENLEQALAYDLDRHTPFKPDEVYFDAVVVGRDPQKNEIRVDWAAALKTVVEQACRRAESWGAHVVGVTPESPTGPAAVSGTTLNLLPASLRPDTSGWRRPEIWIPLVLIAAVALVATVLPVWQKRGYAIALMQQAAQGRVQADASDALRGQLELLTGDYNFALQRKYAFPAAVQVVEDVTKLLPDDTWLTQLEVKTTARGKDPRREILLRGESGNAGRLVSSLEESKLFEQAAPRSPTTKIQPGPGEVFDLSAQLKPLPPPQPVQVARAPGTEAAQPAVPSAPPPAPPVPAAPTTAAPATPAPAAPAAAPSTTPAPAVPSAAPGAGAARPDRPGDTPAAAPGAGPPGRPPVVPPQGGAQPARPGSTFTPTPLPPGVVLGAPAVNDIPDSY